MADGSTAGFLFCSCRKALEESYAFFRSRMIDPRGRCAARQRQGVKEINIASFSACCGGKVIGAMGSCSDNSSGHLTEAFSTGICSRSLQSWARRSNSAVLSLKNSETMLCRILSPGPAGTFWSCLLTEPVLGVVLIFAI